MHYNVYIIMCSNAKHHNRCQDTNIKMSQSKCVNWVCSAMARM